MKSNNRIDQALRYKPIINYIKQKSPTKILEIGSGSQGIGRFLDIKFDGLDLSKNDYQKNEQKLGNQMNFIYGNALNIPIGDNEYDLVFSCDMIEHIKKNDRERVFSEAIRVCKPGGCIMIGFPCGALAESFDYLLYYFLRFIHRINKKIIVPERLIEHTEIDYPSHSEFNKIIKNFGSEEINTYNINNVFFHSFVILIDISRFQNLRNKIINKYFKIHTSEKSILPYRKYIIINKNL